MNAQRYRLGIGDGAHGPGDVPPLELTLGKRLRGPSLPNWQAYYLIGHLESPYIWRGQDVSYVLVSPRYGTDTLSFIQHSGGVVEVGRLLPGHDPNEWDAMVVEFVDNWGVGLLEPLQA